MRGDAGAVGGVSEIVLRKPSDRPRLVRERRAWTACVCWLFDVGRMAAALAAGLGRDVPLTWTAGPGSAAHESVAAVVVWPLLGEDVPFSVGTASAMEGDGDEDCSSAAGTRGQGFIGDESLRCLRVGRGEQARPRCMF
jgi:hypothetical protein